jgi:hypothetical protein
MAGSQQLIAEYVERGSESAFARPRLVRSAVLGLALLSLVVGCRKEEPPTAEEQAAARHHGEVQQQQRWREYFNKPESVQTRKALGFLSGLADNGQLPFVPRKDPQVIGFNLNMPVVSSKGPYYWSQAFHIILQDSPPRHCHYIVVQNYRDGGFQLRKAWRTDGDGKVVEEAPLLPPPEMADPHWVYLGPVNPGAERGWSGWYNGTLGGGSVAIGTNDPATGLNCFEIGISNAVPGQTHHADIRSEMFSLGKGGKARGPLTFSFAYKLPTKVKPGDNIEVNLRFFGQGEASFLGQKTILLGSDSGDSEMTHYKTMNLRHVLAPSGAVKGDVWIVANIGGPWTSGTAEFDDFSVTALAANPWGAWLVGGGMVAALIGLLIATMAKRTSFAVRLKRD